ncbi:hypothetical protein [Pseudidiomarina gelatinasegens]|uniref:hypothetical protein n=1 Tax=Pseudidiomarina gelatinasegens TaxID=2487740 RepID=UPI0030EEC139|tara:strand:+ start:438 stop:731 length:294 start_codon:yes stop_codon:yes gene_type:complete
MIMRMFLLLSFVLVSAPVVAQSPENSSLQQLRCELHQWIVRFEVITNWLTTVERNALVFVNKQGDAVAAPFPIAWKMAEGCSAGAQKPSEQTQNDKK